ncbi:hypothetical protein F5890DRAFT_1641410 [Lentinula detonsa]|uniref:DNA breaking-rejoining enzyme n=1 Tax=Lentinula detonsa TaxID=2804962 RepID=A0AA38PPX5_9AGAR|nr:hypothetical protein F5890DRAFT_1641410 [Lentinula detonsa]
MIQGPLPYNSITTLLPTISRLAPRKPQKGRSIKSNHLRPNVRATDRLNAWSSPYAIQQREALSTQLPGHVIDNAFNIAGEGLFNSTKANYAAGLLRFNQFCDKENIPEEARMPASEILLAGFVGASAGSVSGRTIRAWLSGLRAWHVLKQAPWPEKSELLGLVRRAANTRGSHHQCAKRNPVTLQHLLALRLALDFTSPFHCAIWAVALTCFWGCRRLGELTVPGETEFNSRLHVTRLNLPDSYILLNNMRRLKFHIPWTKTTRELGADVIASANVPAICPCDAFLLHWEKNAAVPAGYPLFSYMDMDGNPKYMTKPKFLKTVIAIWCSAKMPNVLGHSFRIGGSVELLLAGVPPHVVAAIGGWESLAFLVYWRQIEDIVVSQTSEAYQKNWDRVRHDMNDYRKQTVNVEQLCGGALGSAWGVSHCSPFMGGHRGAKPQPNPLNWD